ncbi:hypothetical protein KKB40_04165 [Patescibacteria group bacterium]|nr:hypothetical protein [Patescibacteria group bacterium]
MTEAEIVGRRGGVSPYSLSTGDGHRRIEMGGLTIQHGAFPDSPVTVWNDDEPVVTVELGKSYTFENPAFTIRHQ